MMIGETLEHLSGGALATTRNRLSLGREQRTLVVLYLKTNATVTLANGFVCDTSRFRASSSSAANKKNVPASANLKKVKKITPMPPPLPPLSAKA